MVLRPVGRRAIGLADEIPRHVNRADAKRHHHRQAAGLRQFKGLLGQLDQPRQVIARVHQRHGRLQRGGMGAFLNDARARAVILAEQNKTSARHAGRGQIGKRIGGHVGADDRFPRDRAPQGIVDGRAEQSRRAGLAGRRLELHAERLQHRVAGISQHIHEMRDGRAGIAAHVRHARLQERFGQGEDDLAVKRLARAKRELVDIVGKGALHAFGGGGDSSGVGHVDSLIRRYREHGLLPRIARISTNLLDPFRENSCNSWQKKECGYFR